jgi:putative integral membrane protein (TIGR02587 family)
MNASRSNARRSKAPSNGEFLATLGRAFAGALIFALPMLMTMEMWALGVTLHPWRIALLLVIAMPLLLGLSHFSGIRRTAHWRDDIADILVVTLVSLATAAAVIWIFGVVTADMPTREIISKVAVQFLPCSIGATLARSQLGETHADEQRSRQPTYFGELFLMMVGALFLSLNIAPTEEIILIAQQMSNWQEILLAIASIMLMHLFVYAARFRGGHGYEGAPTLSVLVRYSVVGYVIVLGVSLCLLWFLGQTEGQSLTEIISACVVISFPGAIGAAAARLVL